MDTGVDRIAAERARQIAVEGWTPEHDDLHDEDELAWAAVCYAAPDWVMRPSTLTADEDEVDVQLRDPWPDDWDRKWDKRKKLARRKAAGRLRALEIAGALIAAEIDRLLRLAAPERRA